MSVKPSYEAFEQRITELQSKQQTPLDSIAHLRILVDTIPDMICL